MQSEIQTPKTQEAPVKSTRFGSIIKKAREAARYSYADLAHELNLSAQTVEWLEQEKFDKLPAPTFVRGYIRSIATLLSLNADDLLAAYRQQGYDNDPQLVSTANRMRAPVLVINFALIFRLLAIVVILAAVIALAWFGFNYFKENNTPTSGAGIKLRSENGAQPLQIDDSNRLNFVSNTLPQAQLPAPAANNANLPALGAVGQDASAPATISQEPPQAPEPEPEPEPVVIKDELTLTTTANAWVSVVDGNDKVLVQGTISASDGTRKLVAVPPVRLHLGNARNITLTYRGKEVALDSFISSSNVAKLSLK